MPIVYIIQSINNPDQHYTGITEDLKVRFQDHNEGKSKHTLKFKPWKLVCFTTFVNKEKAVRF